MTLWCLLLWEPTAFHTHRHTYRVHFLKLSPSACTLFQCSRSCGSGIQKRELRCGERDSHGGYVPSTAHQDIPHTLIELLRYFKPCCVIWVPSSESEFKFGNSVGTVLSCPVLCRTGMWSSPYAGAGTRPNLWWISSRAATKVRAQSSPGSSLAEPPPLLWS